MLIFSFQQWVYLVFGLRCSSPFVHCCFSVTLASKPVQLCSALSHIRTTQWPVWHLELIYLLVQFSECFVCWWALDPCMHTWGWAQKFINKFMGFPLHDLLGTLWFLRAPFSILGLLHMTPRTSSLRTRKKKLDSPAVWWYSKFWSSSLVSLLWFFSSSNCFSICSAQELWLHSGLLWGLNEMHGKYLVVPGT